MHSPTLNRPMKQKSPIAVNILCPSKQDILAPLILLTEPSQFIVKLVTQLASPGFLKQIQLMTLKSVGL